MITAYKYITLYIHNQHWVTSIIDNITPNTDTTSPILISFMFRKKRFTATFVYRKEYFHVSYTRYNRYGSYVITE